MIAPPLLVSFSSTDSFLKALSPELCATYRADTEALVNHRLPPVLSIRCLAVMFGYSPRFVGALFKRTERYYRTFSIPKGKGRRIIHAPKVALKVIQKWFGWHLADAIDFSVNVFGFVKGRSAIMAAAVHCGAKWVYSADIKDFFPSTPSVSVARNLISIGYPGHGAELIAKLCSYNGFLAQGSPASPVLSNLVFRGADSSLGALAEEYGILYTRYADDMVFSGKGDVPRDLAERVRATVEAGGWKLSAEKERIVERPKRIKVHGLLVHGERPRLTKGYRNKIRAFKHLLAVEKVAQTDVDRLKGHIAYAESVEGIK